MRKRRRMSPSLPWNPSKREGDGSAELTVPARAVPAAAPSEPATTATGLVAVHARLRRRSWRCSRRRLRSSRRSSARSVATGTRPRMVRRLRTQVFGRSVRRRRPAVPPTSRTRSKRSAGSSLPSAAGRAPAPTRFGAPLPTFLRRRAPSRRRSLRRRLR